MEIVKIDNKIAYYIGRVNNSILIIIVNIPPFKNTDIFLQNLKPLVKEINKEKIIIYIIDPKLENITFREIIKYEAYKDKNKDTAIIDILNFTHISYEELPEEIRSIYEANYKEKLTHLMLVNKEIEHLKQVIEKDKEMIQKYPDDFALKFSLEQLEGRLEELYKEKEEVEKSLEEL